MEEKCLFLGWRLEGGNNLSNAISIIMIEKLATVQYVNNKVSYFSALGQNVVGNAFRIGIKKNGTDKACLFVYGSHNSSPFCSLVYVNWDNAGVHATVQNLYGQLNVRYTENQDSYAIVDFVTNIYGTASVSCTNPIYTAYLSV